MTALTIETKLGEMRLGKKKIKIVFHLIVCSLHIYAAKTVQRKEKNHRRQRFDYNCNRIIMWHILNRWWGCDIVGFWKTVSKMFFFRQFPNLGYGLALIIKKILIPQSLHMVEFCVKLNFNAREPNWRGFRNACDSACRREISDQLKIYSVNCSNAVDAVI